MNEHEQRARAVKAFRLSRVLLSLADEFQDRERLLAATPEARRLTARIAGCRPPSDVTWRLAIDLWEQARR